MQYWTPQEPLKCILQITDGRLYETANFLRAEISILCLFVSLGLVVSGMFYVFNTFKINVN